jgi:IS5 family transposase
MKAHIGVDAGTGYVHSVTATAANVYDLDEAVNLVRADDEVVYVDAGYQDAQKRPEIAGDGHLSTVQWRVAARKGQLKTMADPDRAAESRKGSVRAKVEHPFLIVKRDFRFAKTRYRGIAKNLHHLHMLFSLANWLMRARAVTIAGSRYGGSLPETAQRAPNRVRGGAHKACRTPPGQATVLLRLEWPDDQRIPRSSRSCAR